MVNIFRSHGCPWKIVFVGSFTPFVGLLFFFIQLSIRPANITINQAFLLQSIPTVMFLGYLFMLGLYFERKSPSKLNKFLFFIGPVIFSVLSFTLFGNLGPHPLSVIFLGVYAPFQQFIFYLYNLSYDPFFLVPAVLPILICFAVYCFGELYGQRKDRFDHVKKKR